MMTAVSKRAVWMAHFWEPPSTEENDLAGQEKWKEFVLNAIDGTGTQITGLERPRGDPMDLDNFNAPNDNTAVYIMAPLRPGVPTDTSSLGTIEEQPLDALVKLKYPTKIGELVEKIHEILPDARIVIWGYVALNYYIPAQKREGKQNLSDRGIALFQYDPSSGINDEDLPGFRLFYQQAIYEELL